MADEETLAILNRGVDAWNSWRKTALKEGVPDLRSAKLLGTELAGVDLTGADLTNAKLAEANLFGANLRGADLIGTDLTSANLENANLSGSGLIEAQLHGANLTNADLQEANLTGANLVAVIARGANLTRAVLSDADLHGADLTRAQLGGADLVSADLTLADMTGAKLVEANMIDTRLFRTILADSDLTASWCSDTSFIDVDLSLCIGLDTCRHAGPSVLDHRTLARSAHLPVTFLRGCGLPDALIKYLPSLFNTSSIQFYSCFISYSMQNQDFADRLHADLQNGGVQCWFAPNDMQPGRKVHEQIDEAIRMYDRLLLILSKESMSSTWVKTEIAKARGKEQKSGRRVLFPVRLVPFEDVKVWEQFDADIGDDSAKEIREYYLLDFSEWKSHERYQPAFEQLLNALKAPPTVASAESLATNRLR